MVVSKLTENAITILKGRYLVKDEETGKVTETPSEMFKRVAKTISSCERIDANKSKYEEIYYEMMWNLDFVPNSPTLMNAGTGAGTLSACYVLPINDSMDSIMTAAYDQAMIEKYGGGVGFPLSNIRPEVVKEMGHTWLSCLSIILILKNSLPVKLKKVRFTISILALVLTVRSWKLLKMITTYI